MSLRPVRLIAVAVLGMLAPSLALAHAHPKVMDPAPDSTVTPPKYVSIEFSEALDPKFSSLHLTNQGGTAISKASSAVSSSDPKRITLELPTLPSGVYVVHWVSVATDGHRLEGTYKFTVK